MQMTFQQHVALLMDWNRGLALREIVERTVKPGMRVLDAGSGSGLIALWAAKAGAEVVAVDRTDYPVARAMASSNGVADRIRFVQADLDDVSAGDVGGPVDVLFAMIYWNDPRRDEKQSRTARGLIDRCLAPGGRAIPDRVEYVVQAVEWPEQEFERHLEGARHQRAELEERYALSFEPFFEDALRRPDPAWFPRRREDKTLSRDGTRPLTAEGGFALDYGGSIAYPESLRLPVTASGTATAALWGQRLMAGDRLIFHNDSISWIHPAVAVNPRDTLELRMGPRWRRRNLFDLV